MKLVTSVKLFLVALWLGAAILFSTVVAPGVFSVLRAFAVPNTGEIAGALVTRTLAVVNLSGFAISILVIVLAMIRRKGSSRINFIFQMLFGILMALNTAWGHWILAARMGALRVSMMIPIDQVPVDDPRRMEFNDLHGYSVAALSVAMIAALVLFVTIAYRERAGAG